MISFIVIGKNVRYTIVKCIDSILNSIKENKIDLYEIIYVDSMSTDETVQLVQTYTNITILNLSGYHNAAIARNIGFERSKGSSLIFLDGDMELLASFIPEILNESLQLKYDFVSGDLVNYFYDSKGNFLKRIEPYFGKKLLNDEVTFTCGGIFAIKRHVWKSVGGMKNYYRRSQDIDLSLRLAKKGVFLLRKKQIIVNHHTVSYYEKERFNQMILSGDFLYNGLIAREHIFNKYAIERNIKNNSSAIVLLICLFFSLFSTWSIVVYFFAVLIRNILKRHKNESMSLLKRIGFNIAIDFQTGVGFLFFYPKKNLA